MIPGKDEVVISRILNRANGSDSLVLIHPNDMKEDEAFAQVNQGLDLGLYERESSKTMSHWLDRSGGNPGHTYVVFRRATQP